MGLHEYLLLCEVLNAKPLFCINCGMSHKETVRLVRADSLAAPVAVKSETVRVMSLTGLAPIADGGDLVAVVATLADDVGTPKRYDTETIRFSVDGAADIVGENPQTTRWGEAVVLIRPRAVATPRPIKIRAETVRHGKYAPASGELVFTPGTSGVKVISHGTSGLANDARLRQVEAQ